MIFPGFLVNFQVFFSLLPPANVVCEGYVFTCVCHSFCSQGGSTWPGAPQTRYTPQSRACWEIWSMCGQSASYWNAILFLKYDFQVVLNINICKLIEFHLNKKLIIIIFQLYSKLVNLPFYFSNLVNFVLFQRVKGEFLVATKFFQVSCHFSMIFIKFFKIPWYFQVFQVYSHFSRSSGNPARTIIWTLNLNFIISHFWMK